MDNTEKVWKSINGGIAAPKGFYAAVFKQVLKIRISMMSRLYFQMYKRKRQVYIPET